MAKPRAGTLGGSNKMLPAREIAAILPEPTVARNGGTEDCPSTGPVSTCGGKTRSLCLDRPPSNMTREWFPASEQAENHFYRITWVNTNCTNPVSLASA